MPVDREGTAAKALIRARIEKERRLIEIRAFEKEEHQLTCSRVSHLSHVSPFAFYRYIRRIKTAKLSSWDAPCRAKVFSLQNLGNSNVSKRYCTQGMLNADLVGFYAFDHASHFFQCCQTQFGIGVRIHVYFHCKTVLVTTSNVRYRLNPAWWMLSD